MIELASRLDAWPSLWAAARPEAPALIEGDRVCTYAELDAAVAAACAWLADAGVAAGDRVLLVAETCAAFAVWFFALQRLDAWPVLVNPHLTAAEIEAIRRHAEARAALFLGGPSQRARMHARHFGARAATAPLLGSWSVAMESTAPAPEPLGADLAARIAAVLYTSGSTGEPKGVMLSHRNLAAAARGAAELRRVTPADCLLGVLPVTHSSGLTLVLLTAIAGGASVCLLPRFDPAAALRLLEASAVSVFVGTPAIFAHMAEYATFRGLPGPVPAPALRLLSTCGSPLTPAVKAAVERLFGQVLHNGYGATECSPGVASTRIEAPRNDVSVGRAYPGVELRLFDPAGMPARDGASGELWVRGANVMQGYYRAPEATAAVLDAAGWYHTGDLARFEGDDLFILGRTKELILRFGFNVYPAEIEAVLQSHPGVARAAVLGQRVADAEGGEAIVAFVQPRPGSGAATTDLEAFLRSRLATYKCPDRIVIADEWPLTPSGKIHKEALRASLAPAGVAR